MAINSEIRTYRLTGITPMLGSNPANPKIHSEFVASKAATIEKSLEETSMLPSEEELREKLDQVKTMGLTVFLRDGDDSHLVIGSHVIKGFFKAAMSALKEQLSLGSPKSKVDNYIFIQPTYIPIMRNGQVITSPDCYNERSLRAETMQGPRVSLASSEQINAPWTIDVDICLVKNPGTAKSKPITWETIETAFEYGQLKGLGQWRNAGNGSFTFERIK